MLVAGRRWCRLVECLCLGAVGLFRHRVGGRFDTCLLDGRAGEWRGRGTVAALGAERCCRVSGGECRSNGAEHCGAAERGGQHLGRRCSRVGVEPYPLMYEAGGGDDDFGARVAMVCGKRWRSASTQDLEVGARGATTSLAGLGSVWPVHVLGMPTLAAG